MPEFSDKYVPVNKKTGFSKPLTELFVEDAVKMSHSDLLAKCIITICLLLMKQSL